MSRRNEFPVKPVLDGTVALVTGASSGIGAATAAALAAQGAAVALAARRADRLEAVAAGIRDQGGTALVLESDITDEQQAAGAVAGRAARNGNGVYSLTKHGVGAFSESLRQELATRYVRVSLVEPGATATELASHNRPEVLDSIRAQFGQRMEAEDIADAVTYIVTRPRHVAVNEILIRPTEQER